MYITKFKILYIYILTLTKASILLTFLEILCKLCYNLLNYFLTSIFSLWFKKWKIKFEIEEKDSPSEFHNEQHKEEVFIMLNRITIMPQKGCQGMSNARINSLFKATFGSAPVMIRTEGRNIIVHTQLELTDKKVRKFAKKMGEYTQFKGCYNSYSFKL